MDNKFLAKEVAKQLGVHQNTLRSYTLLLKKEGYQFEQDDKGRISYTEESLDVLKQFVELKNSTSMAKELVARQILGTSEKLELVTENVKPRYEMSDSKAMELFMNMQSQINQQSEMLDKQNKLLEELMKKLSYQEQEAQRREESYMDILQEVAEGHKQIAISYQGAGENESADLVINEIKELNQNLGKALEEEKWKTIVARGGKSKKWGFFK